ncbi:unnamed protein product [Tetraodon nigroviridis]|uniref:(spotted green pufferfish) hypothetical protein n=1 Tax=Tetraodon nigroviridis TaxID=99883 RepID=Q4SPB1_TETNG|nr:unnamed protein product [Tetraodon nigroviridis]
MDLLAIETRLEVPPGRVTSQSRVSRVPQEAPLKQAADWLLIKL